MLSDSTLRDDMLGSTADQATLLRVSYMASLQHITEHTVAFGRTLSTSAASQLPNMLVYNLARYAIEQMRYPMHSLHAAK
jgi:hypothetical protein